MGDLKPWPKLSRQSQTKDAIVRVDAKAEGPAYSGLGAQFYAPGIGTVILVAANLEVLETAAAYVGCSLKAELAGPVLVFGDSRGSSTPHGFDSARVPLTDEIIERAWWSRGSEPDGSNLAGGTSLDGWKRAIRWAEQQHAIGVPVAPKTVDGGM